MRMASWGKPGSPGIQRRARAGGEDRGFETPGATAWPVLDGRRDETSELIGSRRPEKRREAAIATVEVGSCRPRPRRPPPRRSSLRKASKSWTRMSLTTGRDRGALHDALCFARSVLVSRSHAEPGVTETGKAAHAPCRQDARCGVDSGGPRGGVRNNS